MLTRKQRRELILELIERNEITNQDQLLSLLKVRDVHTTQATISRDLRDLGVSKGPKGYAVVKLEDVSRVDLQDLGQVIKSHVQSLQRAGTLVVVRTEQGHGRQIATKIDQTNMPQIAGTIAGDDTVFIATRSASQASEVCRLLREVAR